MIKKFKKLLNYEKRYFYIKLHKRIGQIINLAENKSIKLLLFVI